MNHATTRCERFARRRLLAGAGMATLGGLVSSRSAAAAAAPAAPVALGRCNADGRMGFIPIGRTTWTHPAVIAATVHLLGRAGARRVRLLERPWKSAEPVEESMIAAGWDLGWFTGAAQGVEFENTNFLGFGKEYVRFPVPRGGHLFPAFDLNHSYRDCDVFVSIAKLKEHMTAGVTLSMKNCFGITPCTIYGDGAPEKEPGLVPRGGPGEDWIPGREGMVVSVSSCRVAAGLWLLSQQVAPQDGILSFCGVALSWFLHAVSTLSLRQIAHSISSGGGTRDSSTVSLSPSHLPLVRPPVLLFYAVRCFTSTWRTFLLAQSPHVRS